ncbi:MAG: pyridoxal 5'-phosphate synthase glutaminase subunit PdxT [Thermoleophilaceae bacterium]|nr:pyridoxal 5'-phosphate synthase glutaminase subunit PdxT [Thermoleophilaceae bacterium]
MTARPTGHLAGVLALQGGFAAHSRALEQLNWQVREVRVPADLTGLEALVLPGGESTTMTLGIEREGLAQPLADFVASGKPVLATCAGAILLGDANLSSLDITCVRNAYGGQIHSFEHELDVAGLEAPFCGVFIRAPRVTRVGADVEVLASLDGDPVVVRDEQVVALTFHPELTDDIRLHELAFGRA